MTPLVCLKGERGTIIAGDNVSFKSVTIRKTVLKQKLWQQSRTDMESTVNPDPDANNDCNPDPNPTTKP